MSDTRRYTVPPLFFRDCVSCECDVGKQVGKSGRSLVIEATREQVDELRDRAAYYADPYGPDGGPGLRASAKATIKAVDAQLAEAARQAPAAAMPFVVDDGGREAAGFKGLAGDCVCRAIAIATERPYREVYDALHRGIQTFARGRSKAAKRAARGGGRRGTTPRNGVHRSVYGPYLTALGWRWVPTMQIGSGCTTHLRSGELPPGRLVVCVSRHVVAVVDGVLHDTYDSARDGTRCVYGYYCKAT